MSAVLNSLPGFSNDPSRARAPEASAGCRLQDPLDQERRGDPCWRFRTTICAAFNADRITIYTVGEDKTSIISRVKTGLNSFKDLKLPIGEHSIAGYCGFSKAMLNIRDVYDDTELKKFNPKLRFLQEVDRRTGYRTKQMLVCPIIESAGAELVGVLQLINHKSGLAVQSDGRGGRAGGVPAPRGRAEEGPARRASGEEQVRPSDQRGT